MKEIAVERTYTERTIQGYEAKDGTKFYSCNCHDLDEAKRECERYENSAFMVVRDRIQKFKIAETTMYQLNCWCNDENEVEIFKPETDEDITNLLLYFKLRNASSDGIHDDELKKGKEIIVCWNYDHDYFEIQTYETWIGDFHKEYNYALEKYKEKKDGKR